MPGKWHEFRDDNHREISQSCFVPVEITTIWKTAEAAVAVLIFSNTPQPKPDWLEG
jgi:hypothetical protein